MEHKSKREIILASLERNRSVGEIANRTGWPVEEIRAEIAALGTAEAEGYATLREASRRSGMPKYTLRRMILAERIPAIKLPFPQGPAGYHYFVRHAEIAAWQQNQEYVKRNRELRRKMLD
jgi:hypothetical protein